MKRLRLWLENQVYGICGYCGWGLRHRDHCPVRSLGFVNPRLFGIKYLLFAVGYLAMSLGARIFHRDTVDSLVMWLGLIAATAYLGLWMEARYRAIRAEREWWQ